MQTRTITVDYTRPRGYDIGYRAENNFTLLALPVPEELEGADSYRVYFESTVGEYLQTELLTPADGYVTVKITSDIVPEPGNMAAQLVAFADGEIVGYAPMIIGSAKVSIPDGTERLSHSLAAEIALNTAARHSHDNKSVIDLLTADDTGTLLYDGKNIGGGASEDSYTLSEDVQTTFPDIELESDTVKSGLDVAMYYALAGMFAKYIQCDVPTATGTTTVELQSVLDGFVFPAMMKAHEHGNKSVLDKFDESKDGKPTYSGKEIGGAGDFIVRMTIEVNGDNYTVTSCDKTMEQIDAAVASGQNIKAVAFDKYILPMVQMEYGESYTFGAFLGALLAMATVAKNPESGADDWQLFLVSLAADIIDYSNDALPNISTVGGALDKLVTKSHTHATGSNITLTDNTEYRLTDVTTLTLTYPTSDFECWMRLNFAASGNATVTLPTGTKYIGTTPDFKNGETWEMSIKDGVVIAQKVGDGT